MDFIDIFYFKHFLRYHLNDEKYAPFYIFDVITVISVIML